MATVYEKLQDATVLFVEDDEMTHDTFGRLLRRKVKNLHSAFEGDEALRIYKAESPAIDIVITDLDMPVKNGYELIEDVRKLNPDQKIVVISAFKDGMYEDTQKVDGLIEKPIVVREVLEMLEKIL